MIVTNLYNLIIQTKKGTEIIVKRNTAQQNIIPLSLDKLLSENNITANDVEFVKIQSYVLPLCPFCNVELKERDTRTKKIKTFYGDSILFWVKRFQCPVCSKVHTENPDFMQFKKRYKKAALEEVQKGNTDKFGGDAKTIRNWQKK